MIKEVILKFKGAYNLCLNSILLYRKHVSYDKSLDIRGRIKIHGNGNIQIGRNVKINSSEESNPIGGETYTVLALKGGKIIIGDNVGMSNVAIVSQKSVEIESDVLLGGSVKIYDTDFHSLDLERRRNRQKSDEMPESKAVIIKRGAFIGAHSIILKGVTIGEGAIIGAGSVVSKDVPANEVWAGNPARSIRGSISNKDM